MFQYPTYNLAMIGSPFQWSIALLIAIGLFAPQLLPIIGRLAGRALRGEVARRAPFMAPPPIAKTRLPDIEAIRPPVPPKPIEQQAPAETPAQPSAPQGFALVVVCAVVCAAVGVLLWILLHSR